MKTLPKYFTLLLVAVGFLSPAFAQRHDNRGGGNQNRNNGNRQTYSSPRQNSSSSGRQYRQSPSYQQGQNFQAMNRNGGNSSSSYSRNRYSGNNNPFVQRSQGSYQTNSTRISGGFRSYNTGRYGYGYGQRSYSSQYRYNRYSYGPRRYVYSGYRHYSVLPRTSISIYFGGNPYYYNSGFFYSYYNGFYEPVYAPFGICVRVLPRGYYPFYMGTIPYYYYEGVYYRNHGHDQYEVVDAPMGAVVSTLPRGATVATVNGEKFYEFNGTYYKEGTNSKNEVVYTVVGKYGEINNSDEQDPVTSDQPLQLGDIITTLPENSRQVTIDGQTLFVSPDNFYFKQRVVDGATSYEVVGTGVQD